MRLFEFEPPPLIEFEIRVRIFQGKPIYGLGLVSKVCVGFVHVGGRGKGPGGVPVLNTHGPMGAGPVWSEDPLPQLVLRLLEWSLTPLRERLVSRRFGRLPIFSIHYAHTSISEKAVQP